MYQKNLLFIFCLTILSAITSCYSGKENDQIGVNRLKAFSIMDDADSSYSITENSTVELDLEKTSPKLPLASQLFTNREYIELKTPPGEIIGEISKMQIIDGGIVVLDRKISKKVYLFNKNGEFIHSVGKRGNGPGEHLEPLDFMVKNGLVIVTDRQFSMHAYDFENNFLIKMDLPFHGRSGFAFNDGTFAFSNNMSEEADVNYHLLMISNNVITKRLFNITFDALSRYTPSQIGFNPTVHNNSFLYYRSHGHEIYEVAQKRAKLRYRLVSDDMLPEKILKDMSSLENEAYDYTWIYNWPILETKDKVQIRAMHRGLVTLIVDKKDNSITSYSGMEDDLLFGGIQDFPIYAYDNSFYVPINAEQLYDVKNQINRIEDPEQLKRLKEGREEAFKLFETVHEISNPIIMKCDIL